MKKIFGKLVYAITGWKLDISVRFDKIRKCVLIAAPHTSNWDFLFTIAAFWIIGVPVRFFIKDSWTLTWYGFIVRALGGIGVSRTQRSNLTAYEIDLLRQKDDLYLINSPEGTRSFAHKWKTGFYHIAIAAEVPIVLG